MTFAFLKYNVDNIVAYVSFSFNLRKAIWTWDQLLIDINPYSVNYYVVLQREQSRTDEPKPWMSNIQKFSSMLYLLRIIWERQKSWNMKHDFVAFILCINRCYSSHITCSMKKKITVRMTNSHERKLTEITSEIRMCTVSNTYILHLTLLWILSILLKEPVHRAILKNMQRKRFLFLKLNHCCKHSIGKEEMCRFSKAI